jgi:glyoxylase-like metal-dependent hydrolase (beta-lactamase superfamily II)
MPPASAHPESRRLELGAWTLTPIETGYLWLDGGSMFGSVPKTLWSRIHPADDRNRIRLAMRCLLAEGHGRRVLVDDGVGDKLSAKLADIYRIEQDEHRLERSLKARGLTVEDITDVVLTHLHFDHAGGSTAFAADGRLAPRLPRARYHVQRKNWQNANAPNPRERASYMVENFVPLAEAGALELWDGAFEPWPGFELITADGHTRGQQLVRVSGAGGAAYFVADLIPTAAHVRIPFVMGYDVAAIETMAEKRALLERAVGENAWILLEHDPMTGWARPRAEGDDFAWAEREGAEAPIAAPPARTAGG